MLGARECPIVVWGNGEQCSSSFEGLVATVTSWLCGSNKSTGTLTFMLGSPKQCGPRGLRVALSPWPFLSGILSVDAPLRNFSRGLLIGSHCSGAFIAAHQQHHRRRRILAITMGRDSSALRSFCYLQKQISRVSIAQSVGFTCGI